MLSGELTFHCMLNTLSIQFRLELYWVKFKNITVVQWQAELRLDAGCWRRRRHEQDICVNCMCTCIKVTLMLLYHHTQVFPSVSGCTRYCGRAYQPGSLDMVLQRCGRGTLCYRWHILANWNGEFLGICWSLQSLTLVSVIQIFDEASADTIPVYISISTQYVSSLKFILAKIH